MIRRALAFTLWTTCAATAAQACGFHTYAPQPTIVDRMLASDHIVLARAGAENPFRFEALEALEGTTEHVEIPQLVDSATRRKLASDAAASVLFARDGAYGPWQRVAYVDGAMAPVIETVVDRLPSWELGDDMDRFGYFASLVNHPDPDVHRLALRELDQADYSVLGALGLDPDVDRMTTRLALLHEADLRPIRILLLGFVDGVEVGGFLSGGVSTYARLGGVLLGAYTTAYIEHSGVEAVRQIAENHLSNRSLPIESREMIAEALAIHSQNGSEELQGEIREVLSGVVSKDPALAPAVARQFGFRNDWSQSAVLEQVLRSRALTSPADVIVLSQYVALANQAVEFEQN